MRMRRRGKEKRGEERGERERFVWLVSWCFEPSQPLRITSGLRERERQTDRHRQTDKQTDRELGGSST